MNGFDKIRERLRAIIDGNGRWHMAETITIGTQDFFSSRMKKRKHIMLLEMKIWVFF